MKILVPIKRVVDAYVKVRVKADQSDVETNNLKMEINPFCEIAVEEAIRIKEAGKASEVVVVTVGPKASQEQLRTALALGADRAIHIESEAQLEPLSIAKLLQAVQDKEQADLIILGKQSIDGDNNQTGQMLAALLDIPQATFASEISLENETLTVVREIDGGLQTLNMPLPALVTADLRLNEPRYAKLPDIMKAKRKPMDCYTTTDLGVECRPHLACVKVTSPTERQAGVMVSSVEELLEKLQHEAKVI